MYSWILYFFLFLISLSFLLISAYKVQYWRSLSHSYNYLPLEIQRNQRLLLDSRPLPPRKGVIQGFLSLFRRTPAAPPSAYDPAAQAQSVLLLRLPPELRLYIYKKALGDSRIHCVPLRKSVGYFTCPLAVTESCTCHLDNGREGFKLWCNMKTLPEGVEKPSLEFLRTCRQIYVEASDIFYTTNIFSIHSIWIPIDMPNVLQARRLHQIRKLSLSFNFGKHGIIPLMSPISQNPMHLPATDQTWIKAWKSLSAHFTGVEELNISLEMRSLDLFIQHQGETWLQPLLEAAKLPLKHCSVSLQGWDDRFKHLEHEIPGLEQKLESLILGTSKLAINNPYNDSFSIDPS